MFSGASSSAGVRGVASQVVIDLFPINNFIKKNIFFSSLQTRVASELERLAPQILFSQVMIQINRVYYWDYFVHQMNITINKV